VFGKKLSEYIRFESWVLILIAVVWAVRLGLSLTGTPYASARWVSVNIVILVGLIWASIAVHTSGFGSYKQLLGLFFFQAVVQHWLIALAILFAIVTGTQNIYTAPEVSGGGDGANWIHFVAHAVAAALLVPLAMWLFGSIILFVTKRVKPA
jgi:hypothetical protein